MRTPAPRIALYTDKPGWHCRRLRAAFEALGCDVKVVRPQACGFELRTPVDGLRDDGLRDDGLRIDGFDDRLPDAVFVRSVPAGSFEQVTLRLSVLHALAACGVVVYNDARMIERTVDKGMTSWLLHRAGVPTPRTWVTEDPPQVDRLMAQAPPGMLVRKPLFGAEGEGLRRVGGGLHATDDAPGGVHYLQQFVASDVARGARDLRVLVVGGRARAAMRREVAQGWVTNVARGAQCARVPLEPEDAALAEAACAALAQDRRGLDYGGVDIIRDAQGRRMVLEVNSVPAWRGLQSVCDEDIAGWLAQDLVLRRLGPDLRPGLQPGLQPDMPPDLRPVDHAA